VDAKQKAKAIIIAAMSAALWTAVIAAIWSGFTNAIAARHDGVLPQAVSKEDYEVAAQAALKDHGAPGAISPRATANPKPTVPTPPTITDSARGFICVEGCAAFKRSDPLPCAVFPAVMTGRYESVDCLTCAPARSQFLTRPPDYRGF
jgi:hypothetical protein